VLTFDRFIGADEDEADEEAAIAADDEDEC
jgi:hypothetical protein